MTPILGLVGGSGESVGRRVSWRVRGRGRAPNEMGVVVDVQG